MEKVKHFIDTQIKRNDSAFWLVFCCVEMIVGFWAVTRFF